MKYKTNSNSDRNGKVTGIKIIFTLALLVIIGFLIFAVKTKISVGQQSIKVSAGLMESCQYNTSDLLSVEMADSIPSHSKITGTNFGSIERGSFNVSGWGKGNLYIESNSGQYVVMKFKNGFIIYRPSDPEKAKEVFNEVSKLTPQ
jgi:hypothetical protein